MIKQHDLKRLAEQQQQKKEFTLLFGFKGIVARRYDKQETQRREQEAERSHVNLRPLHENTESG